MWSQQNINPINRNWTMQQKRFKVHLLWVCYGHFLAASCPWNKAAHPDLRPWDLLHLVLWMLFLLLSTWLLPFRSTHTSSPNHSNQVRFWGTLPTTLSHHTFYLLPCIYCNLRITILLVNWCIFSSTPC